ncbi:MAG: LrgB family protein [Tissierellales bacterium]|jgi:predicted murein hydrolase (TIGR00659 family)|nr:LrgB family protein [Tissierellales bacterium]
MLIDFVISITCTIIIYFLFSKLSKKWPFPLFNPVLMSILTLVYILLSLEIPYERYDIGGQWISFFLGPITVMFAIPIYKQIPTLKKHWKSILIGISAGVLTSFAVVCLMAMGFGIEKNLLLSLLPKSITTPMGIAACESIGGIVSITIISIIITGVVGHMLTPSICKVCKIDHPVARGIAIGTSSHAMGTTRALEMGEVEGAMSSLSIGITGIITVILLPILLKLLPL